MSGGTTARAASAAPAVDLRADHFISVEDLAQQLAAGQPPVLLDIRFRPGLADPQAEYDAGHLPGAHYVHLPTVLADAGTHRPASDGALPLPRPEVLQEHLRAYGISEDSPVVAYDNRHGLSAARAWWVLRWAGLPDVRVLDGGYGYWASQDFPITTEVPRPRAGTITVRLPHGTNSARLATLSTDEAAVFTRADAAHAGPAAGVLIDAREAEHFTGETATKTATETAGATGAPQSHIPGARNLPSSADLDGHGLLLPAEVLRARAEAAGLTSGAAVGTYCGAGVLAAHKVLTLATLGIDAALYVGSWSAWSASAGDTLPPL